MPLRFARAQQSRDAFLDITRLQLAEATLPEDVISLALEARRLTPWSAASHSASHSASRNLFGNLPGLQSVEDTDDLSGLVDQLRARLGQDACYILEVEDQHTPERAWKRALPLRHARPPTRKQANKPAGKRPGKQKTKPQENAPRLLKRPLWLFDPPRPVDRRQLALLRGPERIHTGWWLDDGDELHDPPGQARDYYVARHHSGARCWVFTDPWQRWFLHGYFS
jgi:protein ImuB